ncbi:MAG TPA: helix-turn-helix domain-containing protein [Pyrinomonadaceae bacterium]|jgi:excisionase family DNA binding protein
MGRSAGTKARSTTAAETISESERASLYTTQKAASYLGYTPGGVRKLVSLKKLHPRKIGRCLLFSKEDLDYFNENLRMPRGRPIRPVRSKSLRIRRERGRQRVREYRMKQAAQRDVGTKAARGKQKRRPQKGPRAER